jgi:circadian clock protein KaiC
LSTPQGNVSLKNGIAKSLTGIPGFDQITEGALPKGRPTLVCGSAGCGKTILAMEFLVRGATEFNEPGAFMAFEVERGQVHAPARHGNHSGGPENRKG